LRYIVSHLIPLMRSKILCGSKFVFSIYMCFPVYMFLLYMLFWCSSDSCSAHPCALQGTCFFNLCYPDAVQPSYSAHTCALKIMCWFHILFLVHKLITIWTEKNISLVRILMIYAACYSVRAAGYISNTGTHNLFHIFGPWNNLLE